MFAEAFTEMTRNFGSTKPFNRYVGGTLRKARAKREQADTNSERPSGTKGKASAILEQRILDTATQYATLTVRQLYYILVSTHGYPSTRNFYKILDYHLSKMRRKNRTLHEKFVDPTRHFVIAPLPFRSIELWVEKDSIRNFLEPLASKYRLSIQVLRGFGSLSMYRKALERAFERGVKKILYMGDFDPSGLLIDRVAAREMRMSVRRIALTKRQIDRHSLPSIPVNLKDSRAEDYIAKYGSRCWEIEALRPKAFLRLVEEQLKKNVPSAYLTEANAKNTASRLARPLVEKLRRLIESEALRLLKAGKSVEEIRSSLASLVKSQKSMVKEDSGKHERESSKIRGFRNRKIVSSRIRPRRNRPKDRGLNRKSLKRDQTVHRRL